MVRQISLGQDDIGIGSEDSPIVSISFCDVKKIDFYVISLS